MVIVDISHIEGNVHFFFLVSIFNQSHLRLIHHGDGLIHRYNNKKKNKKEKNT